MAERPNVLVLLSDEHSPLTLGCYGSRVVQTPNLDALAARGVLFEQAYCQAPVCVPSRLSFLSGLYPWRIRAWSNVSPVPVERTSLAGYLRQHGYFTATIGKMHFVGPEQQWGFAYRPYGDFVGCSHQPDPIGFAPRLTILPAGPAEIPEAEQQESIVNRLGIEFLRTYDRPEPFCLWLSYNRPHFPLRVPERYWARYWPDGADLPDLGPNFPERLHPWMRFHRWYTGVEGWTEAQWREARAGYYAAVSFIDDKVGEVLRVLDELGLRENTIVVYFSDHGEMNGEHGLVRKMTFYEPSARVPLIISYPKRLPQGRRVGAVVELVDLYPTLAELAGLPAPEGLDGRSLVPLMTTGSAAGRKGYAIAEHYSHGVPGPMRMVRLGEWKYILYLDAKPSLFNLKEDPQEFHDRIDDPGVQRIVRECEGLLRTDWDEALVRASFVPSPTPASNQNRRPNRPPNQYLTPEGELVDAETFYGDVDWSQGPL
ncbi:MAG TPA: sulfatase-like hydrolase/transferase [Chloroflexota bacterium]